MGGGRDTGRLWSCAGCEYLLLFFGEMSKGVDVSFSCLAERSCAKGTISVAKGATGGNDSGGSWYVNYLYLFSNLSNGNYSRYASSR